MANPESSNTCDRRDSRHTSLRAFAVVLASVMLATPMAMAAQQPAGKSAVSSLAPGTPFSADVLASLLPSAVYFQGRTAPLQLRNAAGFRLPGGAIVWMSLVDTSGYASEVQEKYQFYLVTEGPLRFGDANLPSGAYGAGFVGGRFLVMDMGGHTLAQGAVQTDAALRRPRPLQLVPDAAGGGMRLYLGRTWVQLGQGAGSEQK